MFKKIIFGTFAALAIPAMVAYAATPMLTVSGQGSGNVGVSVSQGEINAPVVLYYNSTAIGTVQGFQIGTTNANGDFSGTINTDAQSINGSSPVYVQVGGYQSNMVTWPYISGGTSNPSFVAGSSNNGTIMFNQNSPMLSVGQTGTVILSGGTGTYYIASNSNAGGVTPTISGNVLTLSGAAAGQSNIVVCSTGGGCGTLTTTVQGTSGPMLNQSALTFNQNGQGSVTLSGGMSPFTVQIPSGSGISTMLMGNTLFVNGTATGTNVINVCSSNTSSNGTSMGSGCTPLTVNVQAQSSSNTATNMNGTTNTMSNLATRFSSTIPLTVGQMLSFDLGNDGQFFVQSPVNGSVLASVNTGSGNRLLINGSMAGSGTLNVCQNGGSCFPVNFMVNPATQSNVATNTSFNGTGGGTIVLVDLKKGEKGPDVIDLQTRLSEEGYLNSFLVTGFFGDLTLAAVMRYQHDHGIPATGFVGTLTRAELNR